MHIAWVTLIIVLIIIVFPLLFMAYGYFGFCKAGADEALGLQKGWKEAEENLQERYRRGFK